MSLGADNHDRAARAALRLADWGLPLFAGLCGVILALEGLRLPLFEQYTGLGAGFMPLAVGLALLAIAGGLAWQVLQGERFEPEAAEGADADAPMSPLRLGLAAVAIASPIATFPLLGFPIGSALSFILVARAFGSRNTVLDAIIGAALGAAAWYAFTKLGVQLGPFLPVGVK